VNTWHRTKAGYRAAVFGVGATLLFGAWRSSTGGVQVPDGSVVVRWMLYSRSIPVPDVFDITVIGNVGSLRLRDGTYVRMRPILRPGPFNALAPVEAEIAVLKREIELARG
jgi:hypothetical protein